MSVSYLELDAWNIIEKGFDPKNQRKSESIFSLGNGYMGQRANFEEHYSGDTLVGNYIAGIYYPDPTKVGWWKNGYPEFYARLVNCVNWNGIDITVDGMSLDLTVCKVSDFIRTLNMREGYLERSFVAELSNGNKIQVKAQRFLSLIDKEIAAIKYSITALNFSGKLDIVPFLDADVKNETSNYGEIFLETVEHKIEGREIFVETKTRRSDYHICTGMTFDIVENDKAIEFAVNPVEKDKYTALAATVNCEPGKTFTIYKYVANITSRDYTAKHLLEKCRQILASAVRKGYAQLFAAQQQAWQIIWKNSDVMIEGDLAAQQAMRFNIFQLNQTYRGDDSRLNIGPKGFTGEKYGATTQWDSEAYCIPYYLSTAVPQISKNLLLYRYNHLAMAIENATNLGYKKGAALFPMATVDGHECQNEWEITFEEIHRNGAIAYAIYNYVHYTGDKTYLIDYGLEVLIAIARFWSQRATFSNEKRKYVILGVTGPNEYENNVNNNWHTNNIASWEMQYTIEIISYVKNAAPQQYKELITKLNFSEYEETAFWRKIVDNMYFPIDERLGIFLQQDDYLDKEQTLAKDLDLCERPISQHWSWDRILRSCFIKQADVLQGIYFFYDSFDPETIKNNFDFYEPRTVHESSLSPCIHALLAARLGYGDKAYELFMRTARLDLDDYNHEVAAGCHITSMAGTWLALVHGFAGMHIKEDKLHFNPFIVQKWQAYAFKILFRENLLSIRISKDKIEIQNESETTINVVIFGKSVVVEAYSTVVM